MKNDKTVLGHMPYFITGNEKLINELLAHELDKWDRVRATEELAKVPTRFKTLTGAEMTNSTGLNLFIEMVRYLRSGEQFFLRIGAWEPTIKEAQKQVLHYHNIQYADNKKNDSSHSGLLNQSTSDKGKKKDVFSTGPTSTKEV